MSTRFIERSVGMLLCAAELYPLTGVSDGQTREPPCHLIDADTLVYESTRLSDKMFAGDTFIQPNIVTWTGEEQMMFSFGVSLSSRRYEVLPVLNSKVESGSPHGGKICYAIPSIRARHSIAYASSRHALLSSLSRMLGRTIPNLLLEDVPKFGRNNTFVTGECF